MSNNGTSSTTRSDESVNDIKHCTTTTKSMSDDDGTGDTIGTNDIANKKQKTSSRNNDIEIWCNLIKVDSFGNEESKGEALIRVPTTTNTYILDIQKMVKAEFPIKLQNVDADDLQVFASNITQTPLSIDEKWDSSFGGNTLKAPLIVKAPLYKSDPKGMYIL